MTQLRPNHRVLGCFLDLCHEGVVLSIELDPEARHMKEHGGVLLDLNGSSIGCKMAYTILIDYHSSDLPYS